MPEGTLSSADYAYNDRKLASEEYVVASLEKSRTQTIPCRGEQSHVAVGHRSDELELALRDALTLLGLHRCTGS